jgi:hypothetical protein
MNKGKIIAWYFNGWLVGRTKYFSEILFVKNCKRVFLLNFWTRTNNFLLFRLLFCRVLTEFRVDGIPYTVFTSVYSVCYTELSKIPRNYKEFCVTERVSTEVTTVYGIPSTQNSVDTLLFCSMKTKIKCSYFKKYKMQTFPCLLSPQC